MSLLGISLYPHLQSIPDMIRQLDHACSTGYTEVYTTIQSRQAWENESSLSTPFRWLISECRKRHLHLHVDINRKIMDQLKATPSDLSAFVRLGIRIIRLDFGFEEDHEFVAEMTCNENGVLIEDNTSMQANPIHRIKAMQKKGNLNNYITVHNFFPLPDTGLSFEDTVKNARLFHACGICTGVFLNSLDSTSLLFPQGHGLCTVENHRYKPASLSMSELFAAGVFDYIFFGDGDPSLEEMKQVSLINTNQCVEVPVYFSPYLSSQLKEKLLNTRMKSRSDQPEFLIRAVQTRGIASICPTNTIDRDKLCITMNNSLSGKYEGELQIALKNMPGREYINVIGQIDMRSEPLIQLIRYGKISFRLIEAQPETK